ncbi:MAG TPA: hypothetical protein VFR62_07700, partial [Gemmatimonadales bacterium]|nr:hypothetical protein [Gemmatimonadales bacterium]
MSALSGAAGVAYDPELTRLGRERVSGRRHDPDVADHSSSGAPDVREHRQPWPRRTLRGLPLLRGRRNSYLEGHKVLLVATPRLPGAIVR